MYSFVENWSVKSRDDIFHWREVNWYTFALKWKWAMEGMDDQCTKSASSISVTIPAKCPDRSLGWNHPQSFTYSASLPMASPLGFWPCYPLPGLLEAPLISGLKLLWPHNFSVLHLGTAHILWTTLKLDSSSGSNQRSWTWFQWPLCVKMAEFFPKYSGIVKVPQVSFP